MTVYEEWFNVELRKKEVEVKKTNDAIMKKAPDILAAKMTPRSPKNNFGNKQTIALILKKIGP